MLKGTVLPAVAVSLVGTFGAEMVSAKDVALLISNERYQNIRRYQAAGQSLVSPLANAYKAEGYEVFQISGANAQKLAAGLQEFYNRSLAADRVVIHYNGLMFAGPFDSHIATIEHVGKKAVERGALTPSIQFLAKLMEHRPGKAALLLGSRIDFAAAFERNDQHFPQGVLVMGGAPRDLANAVARDLITGQSSPQAIAEANAGKLVAAGYVTDIPFVTTTDPAIASIGTNTTTAPAPSGNGIAEMGAWRDATQAGTREALEGYLRAYPNGLFANEAKARIEALGPVISPEQAMEDNLRLTRADRRDIQRKLTLLGFDTRGVDGIFGGGTRRAIGAWQRDARFRETGYLDQSQIRVLNQMATDRQAELDRQAAAEKEARDEADLAYWRATGASGRERELREYLARYPDGLFASQARRDLEEIEAARGASENSAAAQTEAKLGLNSRTRRIVEQRLSTMGFNPGPVDGTFDGNTRNAIAQFQRQSGLAQTGYLDNATVGQIVAASFR